MKAVLAFIKALKSMVLTLLLQLLLVMPKKVTDLNVFLPDWVARE
jgi:hypothetical protein